MKSLSLIIVLILSVSSLGFAPLAAPVTYFVSVTGNDQNFGTESSPFRTIAHGVSVAQIGDTVKVAAGSYAERISVSRSSVSVLCIVLHSCVTKGATLNAAGVVVDGFDVKDAIGTCWIIYGAGTVKNSDCNGVALSSGSGPDSDGGRVFDSGGAFINVSVRGLATGPVPHPDCFMTFANRAAQNVLFDGVYCENYSIYIAPDGSNLKAQGFMIEGGARNWTIKNTVIHSYRCINFGDSDDPSNNGDIVIINLTCVGGPRTNNFENYGVFIGSHTDKVTVSYSHFYNVDGPIFIGSVTNGGHNLSYRDGNATLRNAPCGSTDICNVNPKIDSTYHPLVGSPLCLAGGGYIGAYNCGGAPVPTFTPTPTVPATATKTPAPIPPSPTKTATGSPTASRTANPPTLTRTASPEPTGSGTATELSPSATPTPSKTPTKAPTATLTTTSVPPPTVTSSSTPGVPTSTRTPIVVTITPTATPSPTPTPSCNDIKITSWATFLQWLRCRLGR